MRPSRNGTGSELKRDTRQERDAGREWTLGEHGKVTVAVVFGGRSPEHAISCAGAGTVLASLDRDRYDVVPVGILPDGRWVLARDEPERLAIAGGSLPSVAAVAENGPLPVLAGLPELAGVPVLAGVDVVMPILHGPFGEDGTIQGLLEMAGVPYVGAGVLASAVSMDKEYMKLVFEARGLPVCPYRVLRDRDMQRGREPDGWQPVLDAVAGLGFPVFVKPARGGSSIGTSRATCQDSLIEAVRAARRYDPKVIVEQAVDGVEIECAVLEGPGGGPPDVSVPGQLVLGGGEGFYDFEAKYLDPSGGMIIPAPLPAADTERIRGLAAAAFDAVSCEGFARVDFFRTRGGSVILNEINTIPGLTATSYFPRLWEASGLPLRDLLDRMIKTALGKHREGTARRAADAPGG